VDDPETAARLVARLHEVADLADVVIPLHPRGRKVLMEAGLADHDRMHVLDPLGYIEFIAAVREAAVVVTDSGGIQEETTILGVPCLTVRPNTERPITITHGTNRLVTFDELVPAARKALESPRPDADRVPPLWDGKAGPRIAEIITRYLG
jgi:UDP-N-acetylglucosamine 2-epimerase (non-hydrolysing)